MKAGSHVYSDDSPNRIGVVLIARGCQVKVLWPDYVSRWHDDETLRIVPTNGSELKEKKQ